MPLTVGLDISCLIDPQPTGVSRYIGELAHALPRVAPELTYRALVRFSRYKRPRLVAAADIPDMPRRALVRGLELLAFRDLDLFHSLDMRLPRHVGRLICTVYDLSSLKSDRFATETYRRDMLKKYQAIVDSADAIIAISEQTRTDLIDDLGAESARVHTIPLGVSRAFFPRSSAEISQIRRTYSLTTPYILHVGERSHRKNLTHMIRALGQLLANGHGPLTLVLAGPNGYGHEDVARTIAAFEADHPGTIRPLGFVPDPHLPALMSGAELLVFPTLMEGSGMPALEAMACGTPVIVSEHDICGRPGALRETAGNAALTADPESPDAWYDALTLLLHDSNQRNQLINSGFQRAKPFTWERTAQQTATLYQSLVS